MLPEEPLCCFATEDGLARRPSTKCISVRQSYDPDLVGAATGRRERIRPPLNAHAGGDAPSAGGRHFIGAGGIHTGFAPARPFVTFGDFRPHGA